MQRILIIGATGNIGESLIKFLFANLDNSTNKESFKIVAAVRNINKAQNKFKNFPNIEYQIFDFDYPDTFEASLEKIDIIFLVRPPHISDIEKYFAPFFDKVKQKKINKIVFLSVQGVESSKVIPHNKIEGLIKKHDFQYIFLRPSYFMQNLSTTLYKDIKEKRQIILPAGKACFNWIDVDNIGEFASEMLIKFSEYKNNAYEITGYETKNFDSVVNLINSTIKDERFKPIKYTSPNPFSFYRLKKKEGMKSGMIIVMIVLHFLPRFQKLPNISDNYEKIIGKKPTTLLEFIKREKDRLI